MIINEEKSNGSSNAASSLSPGPGGRRLGQHEGGSEVQQSQDAYATALSVTVAAGCSLLILNTLVFAVVYFRRNKSRTSSRRVTSTAGSISLGSVLSKEPSRDSQLAAYLAASSSGQLHRAASLLAGGPVSPRGTLRVTRDGVTMVEKRTRFADEVPVDDR